MIRRLFNLFTDLSLVLGLACIGMWVRSGYVGDSIVKDYASKRVQFSSISGDIKISLSQALTYSREKPLPLMWTSDSVEWFSGRQGPIWEWNWPFYASYLSTQVINGSAKTDRLQIVRLPYWLLTIPTALLPGFRVGLWFWGRWKTKRRSKLGLCLQCGYDLRASPERCPECGTPNPKTLTADNADKGG